MTNRFDRRTVMASGLALSVLPATRAVAADANEIKLFDSHLHLVSNDVKRYPLVVRAPGQVSAGALPPGSPPEPGDSINKRKTKYVPTTETQLGWMDGTGVEMAAAVQRTGSYGFDNSYILDSVAAHPTRFRAVVVLDGEDAATPEKLRAMSKAHGIAGLRLTGGVKNPAFPWMKSDAAIKTWAALDALGIAMNLLYAPKHYDEPALNAITEMAQKFPRVPIAIDHMGWAKAEAAPRYGFADTPAAFLRQPNIHLKFTTATLNILEEAKIPAKDYLRNAVSVLGEDRIMWGSDMGTSGGTYAEMAQRMRDATASLTAAQQRKVLRENGLRVFGSKA
ncbi:MAG TPA: amidohydrolase family protein [Caulobacterales bacterium]|nr:amidohydrolase family protein [Caulobacterales bacterium]